MIAFNKLLVEFKKNGKKEDTPKSFKKAFHKKISLWLKYSTFHGLPNIGKNNNYIIRLVWLTFVVTSFSYCFYSLVQCFVNFYKYEVTVSIKNVDELPSTFPAVTLCNINPFNEAYALDYINQNVPFANCFNLTNVTEFNHCFNSDSVPKAFTGFVQNVKLFMAARNLSETERKYFGYDLLRDMLVFCQYFRRPCGPNNFTWFWSNTYGNCYTFNKIVNLNNPQQVLKTSVSGDLNGLQLELVSVPPNQKLTFAFKTGIYLRVHDPKISIYTLPQGIEVQPGSRHYIGINRVVTKKLPSPYSSCIDDLESTNIYAKKLFSFFNELNVTYYDKDFCYIMCYQDKLVDFCNCLDIIAPSIRSSNYCLTEQEIGCLNNFYGIFSQSDLCEGACQEKCSKIEYNLEATSSSTFPTLSYINVLKASFNDKFPKSNKVSDLMEFSQNGFVKISVNYDNLYYTLVKENPSMSANDLFGLIGGQIGLFLGISLLSLIEVLELFVSIMHLWVKIKSVKMIKPEN